RALADVRELHDRRLGAVGEVRVAVAELLRQVEPQPFGQLDRTGDGGTVLREAVDDLPGSEQDGLVVAAPLGLAPVERAAVPDGDEHVLQRRAAWMVCMDVAGDERRHPERVGEIAQRGVATRVAALVRTLQLDEEAICAESPREPRRTVRIADGEAVSRAAGE